MKIAVVTDDKSTICPHFGRATHYLVFTVEGDSILEKEIRPKAGHHTAHSAESHPTDHHHSHHYEGHHNGADRRHRQMVAAIADCQILIVGGMGVGARDAIEAAGIRPCSTDIRDAEEAVRAYLGGRHMEEPDCRTKAAHPR
ncbi:MAG: NifB/NifX family molybdenum-iron cluster-binding protein [Spirochaetaceae bacterium]